MTLLAGNHTSVAVAECDLFTASLSECNPLLWHQAEVAVEGAGGRIGTADRGMRD